MKNLTLDDYIHLLSGEGMWHTAKSDHISQIMMCDGPHGLRKENPDSKSNNDSIKATCFPTASAVACSFDKEIAGIMGASIGREAYNENVSVLLGPGVNMKRSPLCGRNFEYYSEDPYLAGMMGAAFINGVESEGVGTSLKHFACNNQETNRMTSSSDVDERALREIYLKPFEYVLSKADPATIMCSYNKINGVYSAENSWLLKKLLREEWHYKGAVVSDWGACTNPVKSVKSGLNLDMPGSRKLHYTRVKRALKKKELSEEEVQSAVLPVIQLIEKYKKEDEHLKKDVSKNHENAIKAEEASAILLKNTGILPLSSQKVTIIGKLAEHVRFQGGGSSHINTTAKTAMEALKEKGVVSDYAAGYSDTEDIISDSLEDEALKKITRDTPVLFFGGLPEFMEGEGYDRTSFSMPENQCHLLKKIKEINENVIFISFGGAPYDMSCFDDVKAILQMYLGGEGVMEAMASLVTGLVSPSGRLAETWPLKKEDIPSLETFGKKDLDVFYKESIYMGYRYYDAFDVKVRFPFGYGLSYSTFDYSDLRIIKMRERYSVAFKVKNTGKVKASVSSLLFIENPDSDYLREKQVLKGFTKTELNPGEERNCMIELPEDAFSVYDKKLGWIVPSGIYKFKISGAINEVFLEESITIGGVEYHQNERELYPSYFDKEKKLKNIPEEEFLKLYDTKLVKTEVVRGHYDVTTSLGELAKHSLLARIILKMGIKECHKMCPGKPDNDPELMMNIEAVRDGTFDEVAAHSGGLIGVRLEDTIILSANGHKLKALWKLIRG